LATYLDWAVVQGRHRSAGFPSEPFFGHFLALFLPMPSGVELEPLPSGVELEPLPSGVELEPLPSGVELWGRESSILGTIFGWSISTVTLVHLESRVQSRVCSTLWVSK
jgi:hypothetical protein